MECLVIYIVSYGLHPIKAFYTKYNAEIFFNNLKNKYDSGNVEEINKKFGYPNITELEIEDEFDMR